MALLRVHRWSAFWRRMPPLDRIAVGIAVLYGLARLAGRELPFTRFLGFLFALSLGYFVVRLLPWVRTRLLWSLRNRLVVAYLFIAVVPVVLLLTMVGVASYLAYLQLGAHLLRDDLEERITEIEATADAVAREILNTSAQGLPTDDQAALSRSAITALLAAARPEVPSISVELNSGEGLLRKLGGPRENRFAGIVQSEGKLWLRAIVAGQGAARRVVVSVSAPLSSELLDGLTSELGPIQLTTMRPAADSDRKGPALEIDGRRFVPVGQIVSRHRVLGRRANWLDIQVNGGSTLEAVLAGKGGQEGTTRPVLASFAVRPSQLNRQLFKSLGALGDPLVLVLVLVGAIFLLLEVAALVIGVVLTRTITNAVADLYEATQHIRRGDFSHRVHLQRRDQLGVLGESFNAMTSSIAELIEEQRHRQRLENELSIAREVQSQLFPKNLPSLSGVQLAAVCRAAHVVSGDYYDFIPLSPSRMGMAIADISGKGISAALLMASLQAALRSQALLDRQGSTAELVSRLNRHLYVSTSEDRYATFFYAVYDSAQRTLSYTNAGHVAPFYLAGEQANRLEEGGTVMGLFDDCKYKQGIIHVAPGSWLVAYSDGLVEPENVYGEEFGQKRLLEEILRHRESSPEGLAESLLGAAEQWAGAPEQSDDMTVLVARLD